MICLDTNYLIRGVAQGTAEARELVASEAVEAARHFNAIKRKRSHWVDAMIAGTAITANARLATQNRAGFKPFVAHGLLLV